MAIFSDPNEISLIKGSIWQETKTHVPNLDVVTGTRYVVPTETTKQLDKVCECFLNTEYGATKENNPWEMGNKQHEPHDCS